MFCSKCGAQINQNDKFCQNCGELVDNNNSENAVDNSENNYYQQQSTTNYQPAETDYNQNTAYNQTPTYNQTNTQYAPNYDNNQKKSGNGGTASLILGIVSFFTAFACFISIPIAIVGLILGIKNRTKSTLSKVGIVLNSIGLFFTVILIVGILVFAIMPSDNTFYGDGFNLPYDRNWSETTMASEQNALKYKNENSYLIHIGTSCLSDSTSDFDTSSGKDEMYEAFYDYWYHGVDSMTIYSGSDGFSELTDGIYCATYNYGTSEDNIKGKYILLVCEEQDAVLSFMTNSSENVEENDERALELLEGIYIFNQEPETEETQSETSNENVIYDEELYGYLDSMRNWNMYSELREGDLGKKKTINGGWRVLSDSETYWEFKDGEFWWYKSADDLKDNYWYGTTEVLTGKEGLASAGLDENKIDVIFSNSSGTVTADDVYTIVCTPTKIISGGEDKSSTNIPDGTTWTYVWIIVDHGREGIEAQVLNLVNYETSYYVKIKD
ncbi:MAG: zinc-ribbon domain-containing protein [Ruminococcus sp.]|nr:zinc-ribbon domain-containing protein [Ruminococcus sp.]